MRVNAAIVASLTGAAFAYPVHDSYKEVKEVPAYGVDPSTPAYLAHDVYEPEHPSHSEAPKPKVKPEVLKPVEEKTEIVPTKQATQECISKRSALGLDLSACAKSALSGSLGGATLPAAPKTVPTPAVSAPVVDAEAIEISKPTASEPKELQDPTATAVVKNPFVPNEPNRIIDTEQITDLAHILTSPVDTLPLPLNDLANIGDATNGQEETEVTNGQTFTLPIGQDLESLLPSGENNPTEPQSDLLSAASSAAEQLQKSGLLPKRHLRQVRPAFTADGKADGDLSGNASTDEESGSVGLKGNFAASATATETLAERDAPSIDDEEDKEDEDVLAFLLSQSQVAGDNGLAPLALTGSLTGSAEGSASASTEAIKRNALLLDDATESTSLTGNAAGSTKGEIAGSAAGLPTEEAELASLAAAGSFDLAGTLTGQVDESPVKREAQLDAITALLAPLTGAKKTPGAPTKRGLGLPVVDSADVLGDFESQIEGQLTTSTSAAANVDAADEDEDTEELVRRNAQLSLDEITALLAPLTGAPAKTAGAPAKRQLSLDSITALLAPITGSPAPKAGGAPAKRQLSLDSITALLAPITGAPAPKAGAPAKRQLGLDAVTGLLAPITGAPAPKAGAPAKRQLGLDAVTGLLAPITGAPAPAGAPAKRDSQYSEHSEYSELEKKVESIPQPASIHSSDEKLDIQCIKTASGKCKETKLDEDMIAVPEKDMIAIPEQDMFDPAAPQYHGTLDSVTKLLPKLPSPEANKEVKPAHEKPDILGSVKNIVPVPI